MYTVDLNCDLGESFGNYVCGMDDQILPLITSANVACGFHASDPLTMEKNRGIRQEQPRKRRRSSRLSGSGGFRQKEYEHSSAEITALVEYQFGALLAFCRAKDVPLRHVKPHGALYKYGCEGCPDR